MEFLTPSPHENPGFPSPIWDVHSQLQAEELSLQTNMVLQTAGACEEDRVEEKGWIAEYTGYSYKKRNSLSTVSFISQLNAELPFPLSSELQSHVSWSWYSQLMQSKITRSFQRFQRSKVEFNFSSQHLWTQGLSGQSSLVLIHSLSKCSAGTEPTLPGHLVPVAQLEPGETVPEVEGTYFLFLPEKEHVNEFQSASRWKK